MNVLSRLPDSRFSVVRRVWEGQTAVLFGGGPSLTPGQVERVSHAAVLPGVPAKQGRVHTIAINDAYLLVPWADILYAADPHWWARHTAGVDKPVLNLTAQNTRARFDLFAGERCSIQTDHMGGLADNVHILRNRDYPNLGVGLSLDPAMLVSGFNGGFQAINLAILAGASRVILLGYDGRVTDGKTHWHGGHRVPTPEAAYTQYRRGFSAAETLIEEAGVEVINCSPGSAIDSFPKMKLAEALGIFAVSR